MPLPITLTWVRHGQGIHNLAAKKIRSGDLSPLTPQFLQLPNSLCELTEKGIYQATKTGEWLRSHEIQPKRCYFSRFTRAVQTAYYLNLEGPWLEDTMLTERDWGLLQGIHPLAINAAFEAGLITEAVRDIIQASLLNRSLDSLGWRPAGGESLLQVCQRLRQFFATLARLSNVEDVVVVCHGELMLCARYLLERMTMPQWEKLESSRSKEDRIHNCQVIRYSRRNPSDNSDIQGHYCWMQSVVPWEDPPFDTGWTRIHQEKYSNQDLLKVVEYYRARVTAAELNGVYDLTT